MRNKLFIFSLFCTITALHAQISITSGDMPEVDDTIRVSITETIPIDHTLTGEDHYWDFSDLEYTIQDIDSFVHVNDAPFSYNLVFLYPFVASIASPGESMDPPDVVPVSFSESYDFFKESSSEFVKVGFASKINGIPTPKKYDNPELYYTFPLTYGSATDSSTSYYDIEIPTYGLYGQTIKRVNTVDGWGEIATPFGNFDCIRLKSEIYQTDTIYLETLSMGYSIPRPLQTEYKWLGNGMGIPVLVISETPIATTARYQDSARTYVVGLKDKMDSSDELMIYPNPASNLINVNFKLKKASFVKIEILDLNSRLISCLHSEKLSKGTHDLQLNLSNSLPNSGIYLLRICYNEKIVIKKLVIKNIY